MDVSRGELSDPVASSDTPFCLFGSPAEDSLSSHTGPLQFRFMEMFPNRKLLSQDDRQPW